MNIIDVLPEEWESLKHSLTQGIGRSDISIYNELTAINYEESEGIKGRREAAEAQLSYWRHRADLLRALLESLSFNAQFSIASDTEYSLIVNLSPAPLADRIKQVGQYSGQGTQGNVLHFRRLDPIPAR